MGRDQCSKRERESPFHHSLDALDTMDPHFFFKPPRTTIPYRQLRNYDFVGIAWPTARTTTRALLQIIMLATVIIVLIQALSCGLFFCVALPVGRASYIDLREVFTEFRLFNQPQNGFGSLANPADPAPMLIPRILHQTYRTRQVPATLRAVMQSWTRVNGLGWQMRFYDDEACIHFVRREFPEYLDAYLSLPKDVERSDFFRYMVVLRLGGAYADIDVELRQPLDTVLGPTDTMVVGWEAEVATDADAFKRHFVRKRQVLQWFFAAAPGHPILRAACDHIARYSRHTFSNNTNRDTLERTGPGLWTDAVLRHAAAHPPTLANDPWKVRILPRVAFGVHPAGIDGLTPDAKEIVVMHHFLGSWKKRGGWHKRRSVLQVLAGVIAAALQRRHEAAATEEPITPSVLPLFPVSAAFSPPFTIMTHLIGQGDMQSGSDVSAVVTSWGTWQAAMARPSRRPLVVDALVGSLGPPEQGSVLVDVSAGIGFFSLAAAARGHDVVAFETSARSIEAFSTSVVYNGFQDRIRLYNVSLGAASATLCLRSRDAASEVGPNDADSAAGEQADSGLNDAVAAATRRGYGDPALHSLPQADCTSMTVRQSLAHMLMGGAEADSSDSAPSSSAQAALDEKGPAEKVRRNVSTGSWDESSLPFRVGALRLSAHGWEGWILDGAEPWLQRHRPGVVLLEYAPALVSRSGYPNGGVGLLHRLYDLGYVHVAHAGYVCDERWFNISRALRAGGTALGDLATPHGNDDGSRSHGAGVGAGLKGRLGGGPPAAGATPAVLPRQPTWCKLKPDLFQLLTERAHPEVAENVLFIHRTHNSVRGEELPREQGTGVGSSGQEEALGSAAGAAQSGAAASNGAGVEAAGSQKAALAAVNGSVRTGDAAAEGQHVELGAAGAAASVGGEAAAKADARAGGAASGSTGSLRSGLGRRGGGAEQ